MAQGSSNDIEQLYQLARDKTIAGRKSLVNAVSDLFFDSQELLTDREKALMTTIKPTIRPDCRNFYRWLRLVTLNLDELSV